MMLCLLHLRILIGELSKFLTVFSGTLLSEIPRSTTLKYLSFQVFPFAAILGLGLWWWQQEAVPGGTWMGWILCMVAGGFHVVSS